VSRGVSRNGRELAAIIATGAGLAVLAVALAWFLAWVFSVAVRIAGSA